MNSMTKREQVDKLYEFCVRHPDGVLHLWHGTDTIGARRIRSSGVLRGGSDGFPPGVTTSPSEAHGFALRKAAPRRLRGGRGAIVLGVDVQCSDILYYGIRAEVGGSRRNEFLIGDADTALPVRIRSIRDYSGDRPRSRPIPSLCRGTEGSREGHR